MLICIKTLCTYIKSYSFYDQFIVNIFHHNIEAQIEKKVLVISYNDRHKRILQF